MLRKELPMLFLRLCPVSLKVLDRSANAGESRVGLEPVEGRSAGRVGEWEMEGNVLEGMPAVEMEFPDVGGDIV